MIVSVLPRRKATRVVDIVATFSEAYNELVWDECSEGVEFTRRALEKLASARDFRRIASLVATFYRMDRHHSFRIILYPVPPPTTQLFGSLEANVITLAVLPNEDDLSGRLGVVLHEICHALHSALWRGWSASTRDDGTQHLAESLRTIEEALATAIGNGWAPRVLSRRTPLTQWYDDSEVDAHAKALLPLVEEWLEGERSLDLKFVSRSVQLTRSSRDLS